MRVKAGPSGADVRYLEASVFFALTIAKFLWMEMFPAYEFVVTSGVEGKHKTGSRHYDGRAADVRTKDPGDAWKLTEEQRLSFRKELNARVGDEFDVTISPQYKNIHIELDPKGPLR